MPRPRSSNPLTEKVQFRATLDEIVALKTIAAAVDMSPADYVRSLTQSAIRQHKAKKPVKPRTPSRHRAKEVIVPTRLEHRLYVELNRIGVNLNQMAHRLNALDLPAPDELPETLRELRRLLNAHIASAPK